VLNLASAGPPDDLPRAGKQLLGLFTALVAMPRIVAGPILLVVEGLAILLVRSRMTRALLAAAMIMEIVPSQHVRVAFGAHDPSLEAGHVHIRCVRSMSPQIESIQAATNNRQHSTHERKLWLRNRHQPGLRDHRCGLRRRKEA